VYLSDLVIRTKIKGTFTRAPLNPDLEPNLYAFPPIKCMDFVIALEEAQGQEKTRREVRNQEESTRNKLPAPPQSMAATSAAASSVRVLASAPLPRLDAPHEVTPVGPTPRHRVLGRSNVLFGACQQESLLILPVIPHQTLAGKLFRPLAAMPNTVSPHPSPVCQERFIQTTMESDYDCCKQNNGAVGNKRDLCGAVSAEVFALMKQEDIGTSSAGTIREESVVCHDKKDLVLLFEGKQFHYLEPFDSVGSFLQNHNQHKQAMMTIPSTSRSFTADTVLTDQDTFAPHSISLLAHTVPDSPRPHCPRFPFEAGAPSFSHFE
jgi:hypothetical protein